MRPPLSPHTALRLDERGASTVEELLAEECAVALLFNGEPHVVVMATPSDLDDLATGFALTEGIVTDATELRVVEVVAGELGLAVHLAIPAQRQAALEASRRNLVARSGCGLCGVETLTAAIRPIRRLPAASVLHLADLQHAFARLAAAQPLNADCGSLHAAAALLPDAELLVREDVGRHNALDKVVGALARTARTPRALLLTSRASYELVHKAAAAGIGVLATVSGPTAYAVRLAEEAGLCLIGFAREGRMTVYTHPQALR